MPSLPMMKYSMPSPSGKSSSTRSVDNSGPHVVVDVATILPADSPRLAGEDLEHAYALAESEAPLPPILVHRESMRVVDGMHRLLAAQLRGIHRIDVEFFTGSQDEAFVVAVQRNTTHGLPLSRADREAAVTRILRAYPQWSDRKIASVAGLAAKTVRTIRQRSTADIQQLNGRMGKDGKVRPLDTTAGRLRASDLMRCCPDASLREIARAAGISLGTARDVRQRMRNGWDVLPDRQGYEHRYDARKDPPARGGQPTGMLPDPRLILQKLRADPSLRYNDNGRELLRWLDTSVSGTSKLREFLDKVPPHTGSRVAELAQIVGAAWLEFAKDLERCKEAASPAMESEAQAG